MTIQSINLSDDLQVHHTDGLTQNVAEENSHFFTKKAMFKGLIYGGLITTGMALANLTVRPLFDGLSSSINYKDVKMNSVLALTVLSAAVLVTIPLLIRRNIRAEIANQEMLARFQEDGLRAQDALRARMHYDLELWKKLNE